MTPTNLRCHPLSPATASWRIGRGRPAGALRVVIDPDAAVLFPGRPRVMGFQALAGRAARAVATPGWRARRVMNPMHRTAAGGLVARGGQLW